MKTRLFFGAPKPGEECLNFRNFEDVHKWLEERAQNRAGDLVGERMVGTIVKHCVCVEVGADGLRGHYPPMAPHRHKIRLAACSNNLGVDENLVACDNHVDFYLKKGWVRVAKLCAYCCLAEATIEDSCEGCLDRMTTPTGGEAYRLKSLESGWCLNRDSIIGCTHYAISGTKYCTYCTNKNFMAPADLEKNKMGKRRLTDMPRAKVRSIPTSARPCTLTPDCRGTMEASVHAVENDSSGPHLWWNCVVCCVSQKAPKTQAIPCPESLLMDELNTPYGPEPINTEMAEASAHIRAIIHEDSGGE